MIDEAKHTAVGADAAAPAVIRSPSVAAASRHLAAVLPESSRDYSALYFWSRRL